MSKTNDELVLLVEELLQEMGSMTLKYDDAMNEIQEWKKGYKDLQTRIEVVPFEGEYDD